MFPVVAWCNILVYIMLIYMSWFMIMIYQMYFNMGILSVLAVAVMHICHACLQVYRIQDTNQRS